jgi:TolB-like protein/DNA-binding winged helix-turn-helix (wHTH) protein
VSDSSHIVAFGPFQLDPARRALSCGGVPVPLSSRAFDILALLVAEHTRVVTKDEIMSHVWRGMIVEENNLAVQMSALRRALAEGAGGAPIIMTVPGQGYRFVAPLTVPGSLPAGAPVPDAPPPDPPGAPGLPPARRRAQPNAAWLLLGMVPLIWLILFRHPAAPPQPAPPPAAAPPPRLSIAVLPFRDLSDDRCCDYLADAISDDLTTDLSHIPGSVVIARESSDAFRGKAVPTAEIGHTLNVRYLLEGSLRAVENHFAINAQLIEAATGAHLWAERFEVPRDHLAEAQNTIDHRLASALGVTLVDIEGSASLRERAGNPDALDLFLRARSILDRSDTLEAMTEAQHLLEQAVAKQPGFTEAQAELAWLLPRKVSSQAYPTHAADLAEARVTVAAALAPASGVRPDASPGLALALAAKGALQYRDGHCDDATPTLQAALALEPESIQAQTILTVCQSTLGHFADALAGLQGLMRIDPESPRNKARAEQMGLALLMLGRPAESLAWLQRSLVGDPEPVAGANDLGRVEWAHLLMIAAFEQIGDHVGAADRYRAYDRIWQHRTAWLLGSEFTRAQSRLAGFSAILAAWRRSGMPEMVDEHQDFGVPDTGEDLPHRAIEPTPLVLNGIPTLDSAHLVTLLHGTNPPRIIDFAAFAAVPPTAELSSADPRSSQDMAQLAASIGSSLPDASRPIRIVVMGRGPCDWAPINAARRLGQPGIAWYRGGEEAWAHTQEPALDRRVQ